jgi:hypothetical protein
VPVLVQARDGRLASLGVLTWTKLEATLRYNAVGSWSLTMPATKANWQLTRVPDVGVVVDWNDVFTFSGFAETWSCARTAADGQVSETITLSGADDLGVVANRVAYADPGRSFNNQDTRAYDQRIGPQETVIKGFVAANAGPKALPARRHPALAIVHDRERGTPVTYAARFDALMDLVRSIAATAGPIGVQVVQRGRELVFDCYLPRDLTASAWFSPELGNLTAADLSDTAATTTNALVAGSGEGNTRAFVEVTGPDSDDPWRRVETFVDQRSTPDWGELSQAGKDAIAQGAATARMSITALDLPRRAFGADYGLGDKVTVEIAPGVTYPDIVTAVQLVAEAATETVTPVIGAADADAGEDATVTARLAARVRGLERQLQTLHTGQ